MLSNSAPKRVVLLPRCPCDSMHAEGETMVTGEKAQRGTYPVYI